MLFHLKALVAEESYDFTKAMYPFLPPPEIEQVDHNGDPIEPPTEEEIEDSTQKLEDCLLNIAYHASAEIVN